MSHLTNLWEQTGGPPTPEVLTQQICGGDWQFVILTISQVMLTQQVWEQPRSFLGSEFCNWWLPRSNLLNAEQKGDNFSHRLRNVVPILWPVERGPWHNGKSRVREEIQFKHTSKWCVCLSAFKTPKIYKQALPQPYAEPYGAWSRYYSYVKNNIWFI